MDASRYLTCFWPGLSELWYRGRWSALPAAVAFAVVLNFLLVARFLYPEWLAPSLVRLACWVGIAAWFVLAFRAAGRLPGLLQPRLVAEAPDRFAEAHNEYLQARWDEAEAVLAACLEVDPRDCQSLLMLASVYRHTKRFEAAEHALQQLDRLETADGWWLERQAERKRLERDRAPSEEPSPSEDERVGGDGEAEAAGVAEQSADALVEETAESRTEDAAKDPGEGSPAEAAGGTSDEVSTREREGDSDAVEDVRPR